MKHVIILGGGISGLSLRYFLKEVHPDLKITLLEKNNGVGGLLQTTTAPPYFFERGARTFKASRSKPLLTLLEDVGMLDQIVLSDPTSHSRFIWKNKTLHKLPRHPLALFTSNLIKPLLFPLLKEWRISPSLLPDESIYEFISRRFGTYMAETFFDPLTLGIYAGDIKKLSITSCFPFLKGLETTYGSVTKGVFYKKRGSTTFPLPKMKGSSLFTLKNGLKDLIDVLAARDRGEILTNSKIEKVTFIDQKVQVYFNGCSMEGDHLFCALPCREAAQLFHDEKVSSFFAELETASLIVVNIGFKEDCLPCNGFGYLIPSGEKEEVLGVVFDSKIFPSQNRNRSETRVSVMMGGAFHPETLKKTKEECIRVALQALKSHLNIDHVADYVDVTQYPQIIPQYHVGHRYRVAELENFLAAQYPQITLLGNYLHGVSVNDCIAIARTRAQNYQKNIAVKKEKDYFVIDK